MTNDEERELRESVAALRREMDLRWKHQEELATYLRQMNEKTDSQMEKRLENMNEFREQLRMQANTYWTRHEHEQFQERIDQQFANITRRLDVIQSRQDQDTGRRTILTIIGTAAASILTGGMVGIIIMVLNNASRVGH